MKITILLLFTAALYAQPFATHVAISQRTAVAGDKLTVQQSANGKRRLQFIESDILATVGGTVYVEHSGAAATTTAIAINTVGPSMASANATAYSNSDVGAGVRSSITYKILANKVFPLDMRHMGISKGDINKNVTVVVVLDSTGDVQTQTLFQEIP